MKQSPEEEVAVKILERLVKNAERELTPFWSTYKEIKSYCRDGMTKRFYQEYLPEAAMHAQVSKTAEALDIFGAGIYNKHPHNTTTPKAHASPISAERAQITAEYTNAVIRETNEDYHNRRVANDGILSGRGVWRIGTDRRGLVCAKTVPIVNFIMDPDWEIPEQIAWVGQRRFSKRFELINKYKHEAKRLREVTSSRGTPSDRKVSTVDSPLDEDADTQIEQDGAHDLIEYHELYFRVGLANFTGSITDGRGDDKTYDQETQSFDDGPRKYILVKGSTGHSFLIRSQELDENNQPVMRTIEDPAGVEKPTQEPVFSLSHDWEIPFFRNGGWPYVWVDLVDEPDGKHAASPLKAGLGHQRVLNYLYTLAISKGRTSLRDIVMFMEEQGVSLSEGDVERILNGGDYETIKINGGSTADRSIKPSDLVHVFQFPEMKQTVIALIQLFEELHEKSTGLYDILHTGETARQMRSAAEVEMRDRNSRNRLGEMSTRLDDALSRKVQSEAFAVRYLLDVPDIAKVVGRQRAKRWGRLLSPQETEQLRMQFTMELQDQAPLIFQEALAQGMPPEEAQSIVEETIENAVRQKVEEQGVTFDEWIYEHDFEIEAGSARKKNKDWEIEVSDRMLQTIGPAVVDRMPEVFVMLMRDHAKAVGKEYLAAQLTQKMEELAAMPPPPAPPEENEGQA